MLSERESVWKVEQKVECEQRAAGEQLYVASDLTSRECCDVNNAIRELKGTKG